MKRVFLFLSLCFICLSANAQQGLLKQAVSIRLKKQSLTKVIQVLQKKYKIQFSYSSDFVGLDEKISVNLKNKSLKTVLDQVFVRQGIQYKLIGQQIVLRSTQKLSNLEQKKASFQPRRRKFKQTIKGRIIDTDSKTPLIGASFSVLNSQPYLGTATDIDGQFTLSDVPIGRHSFEVSYLGYEAFQLKDIILISGKELVLNIELKESTTALTEIVVSANIDKMTPLNEMAMVSTRSFSVEETSRYAASFMDPARMAKSFAGVSARDDLENKIIIRGNAPTNLLWRLEGIEIPNPNHYSDIGSSGGAISMLSISTLSNSDFMTGAFSAEYGNTISGVFDLRLRNGNSEKRESSFMLGTLGLEFSTEGPIKKGSGASYLFNYRFSSLDLLDKLNLNPVRDASVPRYQDFTFKFNFPTKKAGKFTLFGLGGINNFYQRPNFGEREGALRFFDEEETIGLGVLGLSHLVFLSKKTYLKSIFATTLSTLRFHFFLFNQTPDYSMRFREIERYNQINLRANVLLNHKFNARSSLRTGLILSKRFYDLALYRRVLEPEIQQIDYLDENSSTHSIQSYFQWKYRLTPKLTINSGLHQLYFDLNKSLSIEPRLALKYDLNSRNSLNLGLGIHSYIGDITTYLFRNPFIEDATNQPFRQMKLPKALHLIMGYDLKLRDNLRFKTELYYQHIYHIAVSDNEEETWVSLLNIEDNYDVVNEINGTIKSAGKGRNWGIEFTLEQFIQKGFYYLTTLSLYRSQYTALNGTYFSTKFDGNYIFNTLIGKEFEINKNNSLAFNGKVVLAGGNRFSPINLEASIERGYEVLQNQAINGEKVRDYQRIDLAIQYTINRLKTTHSFQLDVQNILNKENILNFEYDRADENIQPMFQVGIIPVLNYRVSF